MVFMAILIGVTLGGLILSMIITQSRSTRFDMTRVHSLHAAEAGIDLVLGDIRRSTTVDTSGATFGNDGALPCGPLSGSPSGVGAGAYTVSIVYYINNPTDNPSLSMLCVKGLSLIH